MFIKVVFVFFGILFSLSLQAQMGVGTDMPDPAAELEIKSANRGLLIPRIALTGLADQTTITAGNIESLLVYNTTSNATLQQGFYYWYNNKWRRLNDEQNLPGNIVIWDENNQSFTYIDSNGDFHEIDLNFGETLTALEISADGKNLVYTDEDQSETIIDLESIIQQYETLTSLVDNENGTVSYFDEAGNETLINLADATETLTYLVWNQDNNQLVYTDENGEETSLNLPQLVEQYQTLTSLVDNDNGTISYFDEEGSETIINLADVSETLTFFYWNQENDEVIYTDENGEEHSINLNLMFEYYQTLTSLTLNADGNLVYTDENGDEHIIDIDNIGETVTTLIDNADGTFTYTNEEGTETTINLQSSQQVHITSVDYQPEIDDRIILGDALANDITITLPDPGDFEGRKFTIKKEDNNEDFYLNVSGIIDGIPVGEQLYTALPHTGWDLVSDGTTWRIVNKF